MAEGRTEDGMPNEKEKAADATLLEGEKAKAAEEAKLKEESDAIAAGGKARQDGDGEFERMARGVDESDDKRAKEQDEAVAKLQAETAGKKAEADGNDRKLKEGEREGEGTAEATETTDKTASRYTYAEDGSSYEWLDGSYAFEPEFYTPQDWGRPATSFDFGSDGYTASVTDWHELLQMTAPDPRCGMIFIRGNFEDSTGSYLARVQNWDPSGSKGTWGIQVLPASDFELGKALIQGSFSSKWPYVQYQLKTKKVSPKSDAGAPAKQGASEKDDKYESETGTCEMISFVKDKTVFQIARFIPGEPTEPGDQETPQQSEDKNLDGGQSNLQQQTDNSNQDGGLPNPNPGQLPEPDKKQLRYRIGSKLHFGCLCQRKSNEKPVDDSFVVSALKNNTTLSCRSNRYGCLNTQLFINGKPEVVADVTLATELSETSDSEVGNITVTKQAVLTVGKELVIMATFSLRADGDGDAMDAIKGLSPGEICTYLGASGESETASNRLWAPDDQEEDEDYENVEDIEQTESRVIARCLTQVLNVNSIPSSKAWEPPSAVASDDTPKVPTTNDKAADQIALTSSDAIVEDKSASALLDTPQKETAVPANTPTPVTIHDGSAIDGVSDGNNGQIAEKAILDTEPAITNGLSHTVKAAGQDQHVVKPASDEDPLETSSIAIVTSAFGASDVILGDTFWKIRFLVKAHKYIGNRKLPKDNLTLRLAGKEKAIPLDTLSISYTKKIMLHIRGALLFLLEADLSLGGAFRPCASDPEKRPDCKNWEEDISHTQVCYATITIWYVIKHCPDAIELPIIQAALFSSLSKIRSLVQKHTPKKLKTATSEAGYRALLLWYHCRSFLSICEYLKKADPTMFEKSVEEWSLDEIEVDAKRWQSQAERVVIKPSNAPRAAWDSPVEEEINDRLAFLADELLGTSGSSTQAESCAAQITKKIKARKPTDAINPGNTYETDVSTAAPWEHSCLNHHSLLKLSLTSASELEKENCKRACFEFLNSDYTFMPQWDGSNFMADKRFDVGSVICATLLDMRILAETEDIAKSKSKTSEPATAANKPEAASNADALVKIQEQEVPGPKPSRELAAKEDSSNRDLLNQQVSLLSKLLDVSVKKPNGLMQPYQWRHSKPPTVSYMREWYNSLDDTPDLFTAAQTQNILLPKEIKRYLRKKKLRERPPQERSTSEKFELLGWGLENLYQLLPPEAVLFVSVFDFSDSFVIYPTPGRAYHDFKMVFEYKDASGEEKSFDFHTPTEPEEYGLNFDRREPSLWSRYLDGNPRDHVSFSTLDKAVQDRLEDASYREEIIKSHQKQLLDRLKDSMVDKLVRHRILFAQRLCPNVVEAFIEMWQRRALYSLDAYFGESPNVFEDFVGDDLGEYYWLTSLTISYWGLKDPKFPEKLSELFDEVRPGLEPGKFPPDELRTEGRSKESSNALGAGSNVSDAFDVLEERACCIVVTGDDQANRSTMSIFGLLFQEEWMRRQALQLGDVMGSFKHQQRAGRCLNFLVMLGYLCDNLAKNYDIILEKLDLIVELTRDILPKGIQWEKSKQAVAKLKRMLWALEALRILDKSVSSALDTITEAEEKLLQIYNQGPGERHKELEKTSDIIMGVYRKRFKHFASIRTSIDQKSEQITRLRDGISTVTNLEEAVEAVNQSKITVAQGNNIRILTYITIAYLPLGFVAALFAVNHNIVPDSLGRASFIVFIVVFFTGTIVLAVTLQTMFSESSNNALSKLKLKELLSSNLWTREKNEKKKGVSSRTEEEKLRFDQEKLDDKNARSFTGFGFRRKGRVASSDVDPEKASVK